jgi:hypothetical protein
MKFSSRLKASEGSRDLIFDDAPKPTRVGFYKGVLHHFIISSGRIPRPEPLDCHELHEKFCALIRDESDPWDYSQESTWDGLTYHLKEIGWMEFFDFIELAGKELILKGDDPFQAETYSFESYRSKVNALFEEDLIGWRLDNSSELTRNIPQTLTSRVESTKNLIDNSFEPAREHYKKAVQYLYQHPIDPANSIKEIVSALESIGKILYPGTSTLGDVIKRIKKSDTHPKLLLDAYEKFYAYANATPSIRHGHTEVVNVTIHEAELLLHSGIALIRYLVDTSDNS